jgi:hypothetical protein
MTKAPRGIFEKPLPEPVRTGTTAQKQETLREELAMLPAFSRLQGGI